MSPMENKKLYLKVERPDSHPGMYCVSPLQGFDIQAEFDSSEVGEIIYLELVEMTDEEFQALGEFDGW
jgi:hypothetical protein